MNLKFNHVFEGYNIFSTHYVVKQNEIIVNRRYRGALNSANGRQSIV